MNSPARPPLDEDSSFLWKISGMGTELFGSIAGMGFLGWLIDRWAGTTPTGLMIGLIVGIIGGGANFFRRAMALNRRAAEAYRRAHRRRSTADQPESTTPTPRTGTGAGADQWFKRERPEPEDQPDDAGFREPPGFDGY